MCARARTCPQTRTRSLVHTCERAHTHAHVHTRAHTHTHTHRAARPAGGLLGAVQVGGEAPRGPHQQVPAQKGVRARACTRACRLKMSLEEGEVGCRLKRMVLGGWGGGVVGWWGWVGGWVWRGGAAFCSEIFFFPHKWGGKIFEPKRGTSATALSLFRKARLHLIQKMVNL